MSIKPVDFQVMIPRTMEASRVRSDENHKNFMLQQQQAASVQQNAGNIIKQVYSQKPAQDARITQKEKEKNRSGQNKNKKEKNSKGKSEASPIELQTTSTIDIKI